MLWVAVSPGSHFSKRESKLVNRAPMGATDNSPFSLRWSIGRLLSLPHPLSLFAPGNQPYRAITISFFDLTFVFLRPGFCQKQNKQVRSKSASLLGYVLPPHRAYKQIHFQEGKVPWVRQTGPGFHIDTLPPELGSKNRMAKEVTATLLPNVTGSRWPKSRSMYYYR